MDRGFAIGDTVLCTESGVVGVVLSFYTPTSCEEQTKVLTNDGRKYHAPTISWVRFNESDKLIRPSNINNISDSATLNICSNYADNQYCNLHTSKIASAYCGDICTEKNMVNRRLLG